MTFTDELRARMREADAAMPGGRAVSFTDTVTRARRQTMLIRSVSIAAIAAALVLGLVFADPFGGQEPPRLAPAKTPDATPSPEPTPAETPSATPTKTDCSASQSRAPLVSDQEGLPTPVAAMRAEIASLAASCDFVGLEELALRGEPNFAYTFGNEITPAGYWRRLERNPRSDINDRGVTLAMVQMLNLPYCIQSVPQQDGSEENFYMWPSAHCEGRTEQDWDALRPFYGDAMVDQWRGLDIYYGWRLGITPDGDWILFVAGD